MSIYNNGLFSLLQLLENMESKMKNTCVDSTIPKLFEGKMLVSMRTLLYILNISNTIWVHLYHVGPFIQFGSIYTIWVHLYNLGPFIPCESIYTIWVHLYHVGPFIQFGSIYTMWVHLYNLGPFIPCESIYTIWVHLYLWCELLHVLLSSDAECCLYMWPLML